jgi:hypothetical protein
MRAALIALLAGLLVAQDLTAQTGMPSRAERYPPGSLGEASRKHVLTLAETRRTIAVMSAESDSPFGQATAFEFQPESSLVSLAERVKRAPQLLQSVTKHGFTPSDFLVALETYRETLNTMAIALMMEGYAPAPEVRPENIALFTIHSTELLAPIRPLFEQRQHEAKERRNASVLTVDEAALRHVLTMDEVRRVFATRRELELARRRDPALEGAADSVALGAEGELDKLARYVATVPALTAIIARQNFAPRDWVVANSATLRTSIAMHMAAELGASDKEIVEIVNAANVQLYRANVAEFESLFSAVERQVAESEAAKVANDTAFQRKTRMMDSASRLVPMDSTAHLLVRLVDAQEDELPALATAISCERTRRSWQYGIYPVSLANRRVREQLVARDSTRARRLDRRMMQIVLVHPGDEVCHFRSLPRAPDYLNLEPTPSRPTPPVRR